MLVDFSVGNFLSFSDKQTLSFEPDTKVKGLEDYYYISISDKDKQRKSINLLKIGMIYGANASGKSNFLKALNYLKIIALKAKTEKNTLLKFVPFELDYSKKSTMEVNFIYSQTKYNYKIEFNTKSILYEELNEYPYLTASKSKNVYTRTTDEQKQIPNIIFGKSQKVDSLILKQLNIVTLWNETVLAGFSKISADIPALRTVSAWFKYYLNDLFPPQTPLDLISTVFIDDNLIKVESVVNALKRADFNISGISIDRKRPVRDYLQEILDSFDEEQRLPIKVDVLDEISSSSIPRILIKHKTDQKEFVLPYKHESDGTKRYFGLIGVLMHLSLFNEFMMIDELEMSLHPDLYEAFIISFLKNVRSSQLLFTTHNREFLQKKHVIRRDALWIANKQDNGATEMYSVADFGSSVIRDTTSIYNAYSVGKLGGVPKNASDLLFYVEG